ncbi:MAG: adenosylmethionine--8-amino-7-oxononanoate transaminase [Candidatus Omnitrophica bacterium]|nr:adenosylmethionine--8-amino-7-oxononanoate transaminase [Candidatus Omnitrophota bacterium]
MNDWIKKDLKYNWHPYTQMKDCRQMPPLFIERAKGFKLYDKTGNFYYDTISSWWCNIHGHSHPKITAAISRQAKQLDHVLFAGFTHRGAIELSERLVDLAPVNLKRVFYSDNGSTAVETALKMSFQYWQNNNQKKKKLFLALDRGYHGDTIGAMSVSGVDLFNRVFKPLFYQTVKLPSPYCYRCPMGKTKAACRLDCLKPLETVLKDRHQEICAFILEPLLMAAGGMIVYPKEYLVKAAELTKKYKVHLILDEVATGFGRTGRMFSADHVSVDPDFMCLSKGLTSGTLPLSVTLTTDKIYEAFYADYQDKKTFYHGHTYTANPIACAAAKASLDIFNEDDIFKSLPAKIKFFQKQLEKFRDLDFVGDVRSLGLVGAIELVKNKKTKAVLPFQRRIGIEIYKKGLNQHLILRPLGNVIYFYLPLCVTKQEIKFVLDKSYQIIESLTI